MSLVVCDVCACMYHTAVQGRASKRKNVAGGAAPATAPASLPDEETRPTSILGVAVDVEVRELREEQGEARIDHELCRHQGQKLREVDGAGAVGLHPIDDVLNCLSLWTIAANDCHHDGFHPGAEVFRADEPLAVLVEEPGEGLPVEANLLFAHLAVRHCGCDDDDGR